MKRMAVICLLIAILCTLPISAANLTEQQSAVVQTAVAFYLKNPYMQYDSQSVTDRAPKNGGSQRDGGSITPEDATAERNV